MTYFQHRLLRLIPNTQPMRLAVALRMIGGVPGYFDEAYAAVKRLEAEGLVVLTWDTRGNTYVQRTVI